MPRPNSFQNTRRDLLKASAIGLAAGLTGRGGAAAAQEVIRIGIVGCGGRGTGAAIQAAAADARVRIVAMADRFADAVDESAAILSARIGAAFACPPSRRFVGHDAFDGMLAEGIDVVILASPTGHRPGEIARAIGLGVHVYAERPLAVDAAGLAVVERAGRLAEHRGLSFVTSLPLRHAPGVTECLAAIHGGMIGRPVSASIRQPMPQAWGRSRQAGWTLEEHRLRNWISNASLSGGLFLDRFMDGIDLALLSLGGRGSAESLAFAAGVDGGRIGLRREDGAAVDLTIDPSLTSGPSVVVIGTDGRSELGPGRAGDAEAVGFGRIWRGLLDAVVLDRPVNDCREACWANATAIACREAMLAQGSPDSFSRIARPTHPAWS